MPTDAHRRRRRAWSRPSCFVANVRFVAIAMQCFRCIVGRRVALFRASDHGREAFRRPRRAPRRSGAARPDAGRFVDDIRLAGALHACFVRSPHAHAAIRSIDASAARAMPGVHAVLTADDLPPRMASGQIPMLVPNPSIKTPRTQLALARRRSLLCRPDHRRGDCGRPLSRGGCRRRGHVDFEVLPAVSDCRDAAQRRRSSLPTATSRPTSPPSLP